MVKERLSQDDAQQAGWLLDGYPRSADQAEAIEEAGIRPDVFILIDVSLISSTFLCLHEESTRLIKCHADLVWNVFPLEPLQSSFCDSKCSGMHSVLRWFSKSLTGACREAPKKYMHTPLRLYQQG